MDGQPTNDAIAEWNERGVLVLPKFCTDAEIDAVLADYRALWKNGHARVTVDDMDLGSLNARMRHRAGKVARRVRGLFARN